MCEQLECAASMCLQGGSCLGSRCCKHERFRFLALAHAMHIAYTAYIQMQGHRTLILHAYAELRLSLQVKRALLWTGRDADLRCGRPGYVCDSRVLLVTSSLASQLCVCSFFVFPLSEHSRLYQAGRAPDRARRRHCNESLKEGAQGGKG